MKEHQVYPIHTYNYNTIYLFIYLFQYIYTEMY